MTARAMWKGVVRLGDERIPVKLYSAVEDRSVHFRLLHRRDHAPVKQAMVDRESDEVVPAEAQHRAYVTRERDVVVLGEDDLEALEPPRSRDIEVLQLLPPRAIDHRWYLRPYYLGPDNGADEAYAALATALEQSEREALTRWVMRKKEYVGALRPAQGHLMLVSLRHAGQVVSVDELEAPSGPGLAKKELDMAAQLVEMLSGSFEPEAYRDRYRSEVESLIATKAKGGRTRKRPARAPRPTEDLSEALAASLKQGGSRG